MLTVENVHYSYIGKHQRVDALKGISHTFDAGKLHAIVGPSGSGKSTLLSLLAALDKPTQGRILWEGTDIATIQPDRYHLEYVAMIYQAFHLLPYCTVLENAAFSGLLQGRAKQEVLAEAVANLKRVGLDETYFHRMPSMLSGGEQQRVAIARALCSHAKVILADEPTGNLDADNSKNIVGLLKTLAHQDGYTVIMVTHDAEMAQEADQCVMIRDGKLFTVDSVHSLN